MGGYAWVTLATNDSYSLGALVLAHSLKQVGTSQQLAVLVTPGVTNAMREKLSTVFNVVQEVNILDSRDETNLRLLKRPELGVTFTKLHCWRLTQFDKCVFLDADTLVLQNCDELFERDELSAAPDVGWPDCFNSGVFVYRPSNETYEKLIQFALDKGSFDGGDQGLLNLYFSDWSHKDINKHLPFIYNMCSTACYSYLPAFKQFGGNAKIIHFIGVMKPWLQYFDTETKQVRPSEGMQHLKTVLQHWWDIFCSLIHPKLTPDMSGLAGAFAQLKLGAPRTAEQSALDDHLRRQGWEVGNIDYLGKDSFDNIWSKICETLATPATPIPPKPKEPTPPPTEVKAAEQTVAEATEIEKPKEPIESPPQPQDKLTETPISCEVLPTSQTQEPVPTLPIQTQEIPKDEQPKDPSVQESAQIPVTTPKDPACTVTDKPKPETVTEPVCEKKPEPGLVCSLPATSKPASTPEATVCPLATVDSPPAPIVAETVLAPESVEPEKPPTQPVLTGQESSKIESTKETPQPTTDIPPTQPVPVSEPQKSETVPEQKSEIIEKPVEPQPPQPVSEADKPQTPQPVSEAEKPQTPQPVLEAEKPQTPQPVLEAEKPQTPQPVVEAKKPQPPQPVAEAEKPQTPQPVAEAEKPQTPQPVLETKKPQSPQPVVEADKPQPATKPAKPQPVSQPTKPQPVSQPAKPQPLSDVAKPQPISEPVIAQSVPEPVKPESVVEPVTPQSVPTSAQTPPVSEPVQPEPASTKKVAAQPKQGPKTPEAETVPPSSKKPEGAAATASTPTPTPPPRKSSGGTKKVKSKK